LLSDMLSHKDPMMRAWGIRILRTGVIGDPSYTKKVLAMAKDPSPDVQLQVAIATRRLKDIDPLPVLLDVLAHCGNDKLIPHIVWQNLHPLLEKKGREFLALIEKQNLQRAPGVARMLPRVVDRIIGNLRSDAGVVVALLRKAAAEEGGDLKTARLCLAAL